MQYFTLLKAFPNGGRIYIMDGYVPKSDHDALFVIALFFAQQGHIVQILAEVHVRNALYYQIFGKLIGTIYEKKCPDLIIDGKFYEYKSFIEPFKKRKLDFMLSEGFKQSSRIIINNNGDASDYFIEKCILNRINEKNFHFNIDEVWLLEKTTVRLLYKRQ